MSGTGCAPAARAGPAVVPATSTPSGRTSTAFTRCCWNGPCATFTCARSPPLTSPPPPSRCPARSEEHTSELQSHLNLVCRLLLEKKKHVRRLTDIYDVSVLVH